MKKVFIDNCDSSIHLIVHSFISLFTMYYNSKYDELQFDKIDIDEYFDNIIPKMSDCLYKFINRLNTVSITRIPKYANNFATRDIQSEFVKLSEDLFPECDTLSETPFFEQFNLFRKYFYSDIPSYNKIGKDIFPQKDYLLHFKKLFHEELYQPKFLFELLPIDSNENCQLSIENNPFPFDIEHLIYFHVNPDNQQFEMNYTFFHSFRVFLLHELLSHASIMEMLCLGFDSQCMNSLEQCNYLSHGWLTYYTYHLSEKLHLYERSTNSINYWDYKMGEKAIDFICEALKKNKDGVKGFNDAKYLHNVLCNGNIAYILLEKVHYQPIYKVGFDDVINYVDFIFEKIIYAIFDYCVADKSNNGNSHKEVVTILSNFSDRLKTDNIDDMNSKSHIALYNFLMYEPCNILNLRI